MKRLEFIKSVIGGSLAFSLPTTASAKTDTMAFSEAMQAVARPVDGSMIGFKTDAISKVKVGIIGLGNRGSGLLEMFDWLLKEQFAEIVALSDLRENQVSKALDWLKGKQDSIPKTYFKGENDWKNLTLQDNVDLVLITTPWRWHTPMAIEAMNQGKHVASEVPIAYTLSDCWQLVETAEKTRKHCIMIENCCYNDEELWVLNMVESGVFGELTHAEGAYLHDLRAHLLSQDYYQGQWRLEHHKTRSGNFYTTHGLGPISTYLKIGRGDTFKHLTSMSSQEANLSQTIEAQGLPKIQIKCGDMNTTLIQTHNGKSIMLQFDVHSGSPYSRINKLVGTKAKHDGYPSRLYIDKDKSEELAFWGHRWLEEADYTTYRSKYTHPMITKLKKISQSYKQGHGGMDFVMIYRLIRCLNLGLPLDLNVYDGAMWSAITPLSELSVAQKSQSIEVPDFTNQQWKTKRPLEIMRNL